jgi:hypothetical protein
VRVDQADGDDEPTGSSGTPDARERSGAPTGSEADGGPASAPVELSRTLGYRAEVEAVNRRHAIDRGYERIREIEARTVTPAMRRIEAEDPDRHLAGLENRLKGLDRIEEKVSHDMQKRGVTADEAFRAVKDAIRYTFCYPEDRYAAGVVADCTRLRNAGFELSDLRNSWAQEEYKGINSRWRIPGTGQLFEVQFHTQASLEAKEETHGAYERLRTLPPDHAEVRDLHMYQRVVTGKVPIPPHALEVTFPGSQP